MREHQTSPLAAPGHTIGSYLSMPRRAAAAQPLPYGFDEVPDCEKAPALRASCAEAPSSRARWLSLKDEMKGLCDEAVKRRARKLLRAGARQRSALASAGAPLYEASVGRRFGVIFLGS